MAEVQNNNPGSELAVRREKLAALVGEGKNPFTITKYDVTAHADEIVRDFDRFERNDEAGKAGIPVSIAGRMMSRRVMGKASFVHLMDGSGKIQLYVKRDDVGEDSYAAFKKWDVGDVVGVHGFVFKTKTGEISVHCDTITLLAKSLLPLPEKFHGLTNTDLRYRQRCVDLIMNPEVKDTFVRRSNILREIRAYLEDSRFDPQELSETEKRLDLLNRLELKYGDLCDPENDALARREEERDRLEDYAARRQAARERTAGAEKALRESTERLHQLRAQAAPRLDQALEEALKELNFLSVQVRTGISRLPEPGPEGQDEVCFMISLNPGEPLLPLQTAASGGELSRIMLAIKTILADRDQIPTVIFDEIDSGISGRTAARVGAKLKEISKYRQVLLITHLPQIAAPADRHYEISKKTDGNRTVTQIALLDEEGAVGELARLIGGDLNGESVRQAAEELKKSSQK